MPELQPEDVPDELVQPLAEHLLTDYDTEFNASHLTWKDFAGQARRLLAAVLPAHEQMVRAKAAAELYGWAMQKPEGSSFRRHLIAAHQMVNPPTAEDAARALQEAYEREVRGEG